MMVAHLRRSVIIAVVFLVLVFVYALVGTGISQLFFSHQANGSLTSSGSTLIGQNWADTKCPGHPMGSCVFHGRPDDTGPYAAVVCAPNAKNCTPSSGGDNPLEANGVSGESGATNLGPRSSVLLSNTKQLVAYWKALGINNPTPEPDAMSRVRLSCGTAGWFCGTLYIAWNAATTLLATRNDRGLTQAGRVGLL
jgi:K+-transporting ATPase c subunit